LGHFLNDLMQSLIPAAYPLLKDNLGSQLFADRPDHLGVSRARPRSCNPWSGFIPTAGPALCHGGRHGLDRQRAGAAGPCRKLSVVLLSVALIGLGSSIFHPEASRIARLAAGMRPGFAQSLFQVGGNAGSASAPWPRPSW
jgi:FSR family fosmidomycin resistance protein-like MFS transporter